jgi:hypothetical protein
VSRASGLEAVVAEHSEALFGRPLNAADFAIEPLAAGTRSIYRVQPADPNLISLVVKMRSPRRGDTRAVEIQTRHEFAVHTAVHEAMVAAALRGHAVPRPVLALPASGLLFMEVAPGKPVQQWLSREFVGMVRPSHNDQRVRRCGEWLLTFAARARRLPTPTYSDAVEDVLAAGRVNHHVYCLIGLAGSQLVARISAQVRHRLESYRVDARAASGIKAAFERAFAGFDGPRDLQGNVHGKYSIADVLVSPEQVVAIDLEQTATGSLYLDAAYFLSQLIMFTRWRLVGRDRRLAALRTASLAGRSPDRQLDEGLLDAFIAYFLVNSLRPGGGITGGTARARASRWIDDWVRRCTTTPGAGADRR